MPRALKICTCTGCQAHDGRCVEDTPTGRCPACTEAAERRRGHASRRGYTHQHRARFRSGVLDRDPLCVCSDEHRSTHGSGHSTAGCLAPSVHADHHPRGRDELVRLGLDPDDPAHGRGLCLPCHSWHTSQVQPGGWNTR